MSDKTPFWREVRQSLMVRGDGWKPVIEDLPNHLNVHEIKDLLQSPDQLTYLNGVGFIAGEKIDTVLNGGVVLPFIDSITPENIALQWLYRFLILEGIIEHVRSQPPAQWPVMFLHMVEQGLQFMVYMAALLVLYEEGKIDAVSANNLHEDAVRARVAQACEFLHPKAQDYGESFRRHGLPGLLPRLWDKIARIAQLKADNRQGNFEKQEDSARDLLGYSCIAYSLMLELSQELRASYQPTSVYETESNVAEGAKWKKLK